MRLWSTTQWQTVIAIQIDAAGLVVVRTTTAGQIPIYLTS